MNKQRRKRVAEIFDKLVAIIDEIEEVKDEEQEAYDNMPESLQESARGLNSSYVIDALEDAISSLQEISDGLEVIGAL